MPELGDFSDVESFRKILLTDERAIARNLASQLIVYATGAPVGFADRAALEAILDRAAKDQYGVRTLIHEIIQSPLFLHK